MDDDNGFGHVGSSHFDAGPTMPEMSMPSMDMPSMDMPSMDASGFASIESGDAGGGGGGGGAYQHHGLLHHGHGCCHRRFCHGRCGGYRGGYRPAPPQRVTVVDSECPCCGAAVPPELGPCVHKCAECGSRISVHYGARKRGSLAIVVGMFLGAPMAVTALMWIVFGTTASGVESPAAFDVPAYMQAAFVLMALCGCAAMLLGCWLRRRPNAVQRPAGQMLAQPDAAPGFGGGAVANVDEPPPPAYPGYTVG